MVSTTWYKLCGLGSSLLLCRQTLYVWKLLFQTSKPGYHPFLKLGLYNRRIWQLNSSATETNSEATEVFLAFSTNADASFSVFPPLAFFFSFLNSNSKNRLLLLEETNNSRNYTTLPFALARHGLSSSSFHLSERKHNFSINTSTRSQ